MSEGDHLFELACEAGSPAECIGKFNQQELVKLMNHVDHLISRNGTSGGVPALISGLCIIEAAERYKKIIL